MPRRSTTFGALSLALLCLPALAAAPESRPDRLRQEIQAHNQAFVAQAREELATKMEKMARNPFFFLRGTAHLFYRDMAHLAPATTLNQTVRLNGDAHLGNFGCYVDAEGLAVFGLNDFDEADSGPAAWDLRRLAASVVLVGKENKLDDAGITTALDEMTKSYLARLSVFAGGESPRRFRISRANAEGKVRDCIESADRQRRDKWLEGFSRTKDGSRTFREDKLLRVPPAERRADLTAAVADYAQRLGRPASFFVVKDVRQKLGSGVGSLGRLRYWLLIEGPSKADDDDVLLEAKQAAPASVHRTQLAAIDTSSEAARVVRAIRHQTVAPDPQLGVLDAGSLHFVARERSPRQTDLEAEKLDSPKSLREAAGLAGTALAHAHALQAEDSVLKAMARTDLPAAQAETRAFARRYADQVQQDWKDFQGMNPKGWY